MCTLQLILRMNFFNLEKTYSCKEKILLLGSIDLVKNKFNTLLITMFLQTVVMDSAQSFKLNVFHTVGVTSRMASLGSMRKK